MLVGCPMPLAGAPRDLYTQLLACSSSQSVATTVCACHLVLFFTLPQTMTTLWTNNSLSASFYDESSQPDALLSTESSVPSCRPCMANSAPQSSSAVSVPVAVSVPDPAFLGLVVNAVKAFLVAEKDPGPTSNNGCVLCLVIQLAWRHRQLLGAFPLNRPVCPSKRRRS